MRAYGRENARLYRERHPERLKASKSDEYARNRAKYIERAAEWRRANPDRYRALMRAAYERSKQAKLASRCISCESILKGQQSYCDWCIKTYQTCTMKTPQSHALNSA